MDIVEPQAEPDGHQQVGAAEPGGVISPLAIRRAVATAVKEPLSAPLEIQLETAAAAAIADDLLDCLRRVIGWLPAAGSTALMPTALAELHLLVSGCRGGGGGSGDLVLEHEGDSDKAPCPWLTGQVREAAEELARRLPPLEECPIAVIRAVEFGAALGVSDEPSCVPFSTVAISQLLISLPDCALSNLSESQRRHSITLVSRLCGHHVPRWQLLGLDCLARLFTPSESGLARELVSRLCQSREPRVLERALGLCSSLRSIFALDWCESAYLDNLQCLSYECRVGLKLARLRPLVGFVDRLELAAVKCGRLMVRCLENCLQDPGSERLAEHVWQVLDAYLRYCLFERRQLASLLIRYALRHPRLAGDCRHLPGVDPEFVASVCRRVMTDAPETREVLERFVVE